MSPGEEGALAQTEEEECVFVQGGAERWIMGDQRRPAEVPPAVRLWLSTPPPPLACQRGPPGSSQLWAFVLSGHIGCLAVTAFSKRRVKERMTVYVTAEENPALPVRTP